ncbi:hypothetical protein BN126_2322 [Cronobacter sakazakii 680]|nr:hypothetical protein BN126_2322 [Cronobacter sakazakii 680]
MHGSKRPAGCCDDDIYPGMVETVAVYSTARDGILLPDGAHKN